MGLLSFALSKQGHPWLYYIVVQTLFLPTLALLAFYRDNKISCDSHVQIPLCQFFSSDHMTGTNQ